MRSWTLLGAAAVLAVASCGEGGPAEGTGSSAGGLPAGAGRAGCARGFNLLLVTLDTVRADALGCYGRREASTPNLDRLAARGVRFDQAISPVPITLPSHSSLMTGLEPPSHGVRNNGTFSLAEAHVTLAERLAENGYATAAVVGAFVLGRWYGLAQGFAQYDDSIEVPTEDEGLGHYLQRTADQVTDGALTWLQHHGDDPFFLWVHYYDAHTPYQPPPAFAPPRPDPLAVYDPAENLARYLGEVAFVDAQIGRLLEGLGGEWLERTLVVVTSDHGEGLGEHGEFTHTIFVYDATLRVPLLFSCPALFERDYVVADRIAGLVDVAPTVLAMLGIAPLDGIEGIRLFDSPSDRRRAIYAESLVPILDHGWAPLHALHRLDDKYISAPRPEYFDLRADPGELRNLQAQATPACRELEHALSERLARSTPPANLKPRPLAADEAAKLAALGYGSAHGAPRAGSLDPKDMIATWAVITNAQTFSAQGQFERALEAVQSVLRFDPGNALAWETAYVVHLRRKALDQAETCLRRAIELNPRSASYLALARLELERGDRASCEAALTMAAELDPLQGEVHLVRGDLEKRSGRRESAAREYERARELDPVRCGATAEERLRKLEEESADK